MFLEVSRVLFKESQRPICATSENVFKKDLFWTEVRVFPNCFRIFRRFPRFGRIPTDFAFLKAKAILRPWRPKFCLKQTLKLSPSMGRCCHCSRGPCGVAEADVASSSHVTTSSGIAGPASFEVLLHGCTLCWSKVQGGQVPVGNAVYAELSR